MNKTLYDISWKVSEEEYRKGEGYSYSTLSRFNREGFDKLSSLFSRTESPSLLFGSMVDTLLTEGKDAFDEKYLVLDIVNLSDSLEDITRSLYSQFKGIYDSLIDIPDSNLASTGKQCGYWANDKYENHRVKLIKENCTGLYSILSKAGDRTVVSLDLYQEVLDCVNSLKESESTKWYFENDNPFDNRYERFYQLKFQSEYATIPVRCMMDLVIVDHKEKVIIPCDLKTSYKPEWNFYLSYVDWGYYIQANLYKFILNQNIKKDDFYKDYKILNYRFIVISKGTKTPLVWIDENDDTICHREYDLITLPNWRQTLVELDYYLKEKPNVPYGIFEDDVNSIEAYLKEKYNNN